MNNLNKDKIWSLGYFSLFFCVIISVLLVLFYLYTIKPYVSLPADILSWAETNFVGDIIKLRIGAPIYTPPADSNCNVYTPGAQLLTYAISWIIGKDTSIVFWRIIQLFFITCAALVGTVCCNMLQKLIFDGERITFPKTWIVLTFFSIFLAATAPRTNTFSHALHSDPLSLLVSVFCLFAILFYLSTPSIKGVLLMSICPAIGYFTKQNLASWAGLIFIVLILNNYKNYRHLILFFISASMLIFITIGICYLLWGEAFIFWTFEVMGGVRKKISFSPSAFHLSLPRSLDHLVRAWMEISIGLAGGLIILRGKNIKKFAPVFMIWVFLICLEALISGVNWGPLYHFGPGVVIGTIFTFSILPIVWPYNRIVGDADITLKLYDWGKPIIAVIGVMTIFIALRVVPTGNQQEARYWRQQDLSDVYRYIQNIEREFEGFQPEDVLLDIGNWIYLRHSVLAKDRAVSLADQPPGGIYENIYVMVDRIKNRKYKKILVRNLHSPFFLYDWFSWEKSSGAREALLEHYTEVRTIHEVKASNGLVRIMMVGPVSVLIPKSDL